MTKNQEKKQIIEADPWDPNTRIIIVFEKIMRMFKKLDEKT